MDQHLLNTNKKFEEMREKDTMLYVWMIGENEKVINRIDIMGSEDHVIRVVLFQEHKSHYAPGIALFMLSETFDNT